MRSSRSSAAWAGVALTTTLIGSMVSAFADRGSLSSSDLTSSGFAASSSMSAHCLGGMSADDGLRATGRRDQDLAVVHSTGDKVVACAQGDVSIR